MDYRVEAFNGTIPGIRNGRVYNDADSNDVEKYAIYVAGSGSEGLYAYKDQACTEKLSCKEMLNMFLKGAVLVTAMHNEWEDFDTYEYFIPSSFATNKLGDDKGGYIEYGCIKSSDYNWWVYSKEYVASEMTPT